MQDQTAGYIGMISREELKALGKQTVVQSVKANINVACTVQVVLDDPDCCLHWSHKDARY